MLLVHDLRSADKAAIVASQSDGWFRLVRSDEIDHGHESTGYP